MGTRSIRALTLVAVIGFAALPYLVGVAAAGPLRGARSCAPVDPAPGNGQVCFTNDPYGTYADPTVGDDIGQCTWYAVGRRPDLDGIVTRAATRWLAQASGKVPEGSVPVIGAIAVWSGTPGNPNGHVAYVAGIADNGATLILDQSNQHFDAHVTLHVRRRAKGVAGYIYGGPAGNGPRSQRAAERA